MPQIYVTHPRSKLDHYFGDKAARAIREIADVRFNAHDRELEMSELIAEARDADIVIAYRQTQADAKFFAQMPKLIALVRCAIDIRSIDVNAASAHGVLVTQASAGFSGAVAEWAIGCMIDLARDITASAEAFHARNSPPIRMGSELRGATLGVIGYGQISRCLCDLALAFGMKVMVNDPYARVDRAGIEAVELHRLLAESDHLVCLAIANAETENLMNAATFATMKRGAFFINGSRGNLVDETALLQALDSGHLAGCAVDVGRAADQMPSLAVARHERVIATPHIGGLTPGAIEHQAMETVAQAGQIIRGEIPVGSVNSEHATRLRKFLAVRSND